MLDLTKLKALELPSAELEVEILGEKQTVKVTAPDDTTASKIYDIATAEGKEDSDITLDIARLVLGSCVPGLCSEDAELLLTKALTSAALPIVKKARDLRVEFDKAKEAAAREAKKKSRPATSQTGNCSSSAAESATT